MGKFSLLFFLIIILAFANNYCFAQGSAAGCLIESRNIVYTNVPKTIYDKNSGVSLSNNYCSWAPTSGLPCEVCNGNLVGNGNCPGNSTTPGIIGTFTMVECPLDQSFFFLGFGILISIISVRKLNSKKPMLSKS